MKKAVTVMPERGSIDSSVKSNVSATRTVNINYPMNSEKCNSTDSRPEH